MAIYYRCKCFLKLNFYVKEYGLHVAYEDESQFTRTYSQVLHDIGCKDLKPILTDIDVELSRRKSIFSDAIARTELIKQHYKPLHHASYILNAEAMLHPDSHHLMALLSSEPASIITSGAIRVHPNQTFSFQLFTPEYCKQLIEEIDHFNKSDMPKGRPNSMNNYGVLLDEIGFNEKLLIPLRERFLYPLAKQLFPEESDGGFDSHKVFTVDYENSKDIELGFHFDNSEVTVNVCLLADCEGGELYFGLPDGTKGFGYEHQLGRAVLHKGSSTHCVLPLNAGRRVNLVMWMRNSRIRNKRCPMCKQRPDLEPVTKGWGEGFTRS